MFGSGRYWSQLDSKLEPLSAGFTASILTFKRESGGSFRGPPFSVSFVPPAGFGPASCR